MTHSHEVHELEVLLQAKHGELEKLKRALRHEVNEAILSLDKREVPNVGMALTRLYRMAQLLGRED